MQTLILNLNIKLYGTLGGACADYNHVSGLDVAMPEGACISDLLARLNIIKKPVGMVAVNGYPRGAEAVLKDGARVQIFQPVSRM